MAVLILLTVWVESGVWLALCHLLWECCFPCHHSAVHALCTGKTNKKTRGKLAQRRCVDRWLVFDTMHALFEHVWSWIIWESWSMCCASLSLSWDSRCSAHNLSSYCVTLKAWSLCITLHSPYPACLTAQHLLDTVHLTLTNTGKQRGKWIFEKRLILNLVLNSFEAIKTNYVMLKYIMSAMWYKYLKVLLNQQFNHLKNFWSMNLLAIVCSLLCRAECSDLHCDLVQLYVDILAVRPVLPK